MELKKYQKIEIQWLDSMHTSGWLKENTVKPSKEKLKHKTIGYFIEEDKLSVLVCQSYQENEEVKHIDSIMEIPKGCIIKIIKL